jgi:hypothetical protein
LALVTIGCGAGRDAPDRDESPSDFEAGVRSLDIGNSQDEVQGALGSPDSLREWTVTVPWWGPGESLANELPQGSPVATWAYVVDGQVYYLHFDTAKAGKPLLGIEVYPEGAIF